MRPAFAVSLDHSGVEGAAEIEIGFEDGGERWKGHQTACR